MTKGLRSDLFQGLLLSAGINIWWSIGVRTEIWV